MNDRKQALFESIVSAFERSFSNRAQMLVLFDIEQAVNAYLVRSPSSKYGGGEEVNPQPLLLRARAANLISLARERFGAGRLVREIGPL